MPLHCAIAIAGMANRASWATQGNQWPRYLGAQSFVGAFGMGGSIRAMSTSASGHSTRGDLGSQAQAELLQLRAQALRLLPREADLLGLRSFSSTTTTGLAVEAVHQQAVACRCGCPDWHVRRWRILGRQGSVSIHNISNIIIQSSFGGLSTRFFVLLQLQCKT